MKIGIIDYGMGNIQSVKNAIEKLNYSSHLVSNAQDISNYDFLILPGVGAFPNAMSRLEETGIDKAIFKHVELQKPILGICLGMQLLFSKSFEFGEVAGLDIVKGDVLPFVDYISEKIPHMGWNNTFSIKPEYEGFEGDYYFVHSFFCKPINSKDILFSTSYGIDYCSAVEIENRIFGVQFHPEKSQTLGLNLLKYIIEKCLKKD
jgi:glutamine amidotransferase